MHFKMLSTICFNLDQSITLSSGNGLRDRYSDTRPLLESTLENLHLKTSAVRDHLYYVPWSLNTGYTVNVILSSANAFNLV